MSTVWLFPFKSNFFSLGLPMVPIIYFAGNLRNYSASFFQDFEWCFTQILWRQWKLWTFSATCWTMLNWTEALVLSYCSDSRMGFSSTLCAALSSLSIKPPLFCVTDILLQWNQTCLLTCVEIFLVWLSNKVTVLDLAPFSENFENHWTKVSHSDWFSVNVIPIARH